MLNFLKRFLWPSRISQESIGAMLLEQQQELNSIQNEASIRAGSITEITARLDSLANIQTSIDALQNILQPQLFDIQSSLQKTNQMVGNVTDTTNDQNEVITEQINLAKKTREDVSIELQNLGKKIKSETQIITDSMKKEQTSLAQIITHKIKEEESYLENKIEKKVALLIDKIEQEVGTLTQINNENRDLTLGETAKTHSDVVTLSDKISKLSSTLGDINNNTQTDLSPILSAIQNLVSETQLTIKNTEFENRNLLLHELSTQQTDLKEIKESVLPVTNAIDALAHKIEQEALNTQNKSDENRNLTIHKVTTNSSALNAVANKLSELDQNLKDAPKTSKNASSPNDLSPVLAAVQNLAAETKLSVTNSGFESRNIMLHEITTQQTDIKELKNAVFELGNQLHTLDLKIAHESVRQSAEIVSAFSGLNSKPHEKNSQIAPNPISLSFDQALEKARSDHPKIFPLWFERLEELKRAFDSEGKHGNAANAADAYSNVFKSFVEGHAHGTILDVGCGVHGKPHYLHAFANSQIAGLDPLDAVEAVNFIRHCGIGEYLPWEDSSFDTIISATAIDHVLSLDKSFEEMVRLLKPGGQILMWVGSVDGSKKYTPHAKDYEPADRFHLFHIDKAWFEPELEKYFNIGSQINLWLPQHEHIFYQLTAK